MRTSNPALSDETFEIEARTTDRSVMTVGGAIAKTSILTSLLGAAGAVSWTLVSANVSEGIGPDPMYRLLFGVGAPILGFVFALITTFVPKASPVTAPIYAVLEGLFLGAVSSWFNGVYQNIVLEAGLLTVGTLGVMLGMYGTRIIVVTEKLRTGIIAATGAICLVYLGAFLLSLFGVRLGFLFDASLFSIGFSFLVVGVAAFNLILDFDVIERGAAMKAPKYMEWYAAFGLLVTLVWLYLELLKLLAKLRGRD